MDETRAVNVEESGVSGGFDLDTATSVTQSENAGKLVKLKDHAKKPMTYMRDGRKRDVTMLVAGTYSDVYKNAMDAQRERIIAERRTEIDPAESRRNQLEVIASCVLGWEGIMSRGVPIPLSVENVITVLEAAPWIREQVEAAMTDHAGFFKAS